MTTKRDYTKIYDDETTAIENSAGPDSCLPLYIGKTYPGKGKAEPFWKICKLTYDANGSVTDVQWASGNTEYDKVWNSRSSYVYS